MITAHHKDFSLSATNEAIAAIEQSLNARGKGIGIRLGVRTSGCSGYAYVIEFVDEMNPEDFELKFTENVRVISESKSMMLLTGITVDFVKKGLQHGFEFINPNAKGECGCGESFSV
ncbi:iron-sulfur cluster assembly accessory protein [Vibrio owensii]|uniref:iron-sulfur cluster assembly accessory protein n=1 Tax=Vibrio harveyi group TaxID=717610 RepID=UPI003CC61869